MPSARDKVVLISGAGTGMGAAAFAKFAADGACVVATGRTRGMADAHAYAAAKAGVINLTRSLAKTYGPEQIRSNCFAPGVVDTGMIDPYRGTFEKMFADPVAAAQLCPLGRMGTVEEAVDALHFLALASYCNGAVLVMDGGSSA
jgi:NAD(P)-dependent dehydrogenase (short-subunit alcohol dehydrogenase family)